MLIFFSNTLNRVPKFLLLSLLYPFKLICIILRPSSSLKITFHWRDGKIDLLLRFLLPDSDTALDNFFKDNHSLRF